LRAACALKALPNLSGMRAVGAHLKSVSHSTIRAMGLSARTLRATERGARKRAPDRRAS